YHFQNGMVNEVPWYGWNVDYGWIICVKKRPDYVSQRVPVLVIETRSVDITRVSHDSVHCGVGWVVPQQLRIE
ncbi:MAG: hypothetical protein ACI92S_005514, partial [Planctomycetaceae bacterium]